MAVGEKVGELYAELGLRSTLGRDVTREVGVASKAAQGGMAGIVSRAGGLSKIGSNLSKYVTLPIVGIGAAAIKVGIDFQSSMTKIVSLVGVSRTQVDAWSKDIENLAPKVGKSPKELADALFFVTSAGFRGKAAMDVLTASAKASAAGLGEVKTVADAVTSAVNAYGIKNLSASRATDVLIATVKAGKMPADQLAGVLGRVVSVADVMGVSFDQVGAAIASMTREGLDSSQAATGLRAIFTTLIKPASATRKEFASIGLAIGDFRKEVATKGLFAALMDLRGRIGDNKDAMGKLFPNVRALNAFLILTGKNSKATAGIFKDLASSTGSTNRAFEIASKDAGFKFAQMFATIKVAAVQLGTALLPTVLQIVKGVTWLVKGFAGLPGPVRTGIIALMGLLAVAGPLLKVVTLFEKLKGILTGVSAVSGVAGGAVKGVAQAAEGAATSTGMFGGALGALPLAAAAAGIAGIAYAAYRMHQQVDPTAKGLADFARATKDLKAADADLHVAQATVVTDQAAVNKLRRDGKTSTDAYRSAQAKLATSAADLAQADQARFAAGQAQLAAVQKTFINLFKPGIFQSSRVLGSIKDVIRSLQGGGKVGVSVDSRAAYQLSAVADAMDKVRLAGVKLPDIIHQIDISTLRGDQKVQLDALLTSFYNGGKQLEALRTQWSKGLGLSVGVAKDETAFNTELAFMDQFKGKGAEQIAVTKNLIEVTASHALGVARAALADGRAIDVKKELIDELIGEQARYPALRAQIQTYIDKLNHIPPAKHTTVSVNDRAALTELAKIAAYYAHLSSLRVNVATYQYAGPSAGSNVPGPHAAGGVVPAGRFGIVNERGPELLYARPGGGIDVLTHPKTAALFARPSGGSDVLTHPRTAPTVATRGGDGAQAGPLIGELHVHYPTPEPLEVAVPVALRRAQLMRND